MPQSKVATNYHRYTDKIIFYICISGLYFSLRKYQWLIIFSLLALYITNQYVTSFGSL